jgi:hypothetical protein
MAEVDYGYGDATPDPPDYGYGDAEPDPPSATPMAEEIDYGYGEARPETDYG